MKLLHKSVGLVFGSALVGALVWSAHWAIRASLKAPRCVGNRTPGDYGLRFSTVRIATGNHKQLTGWLIPAEGPGNAPAVVVLHGWGANSEMMLPLARPFHEAGFSLLMIDARCHGSSDEDRFPSLPLFAEDLDHAIDWLRLQAAIDVQKISVLGHSVGAGAALLSASRRDDLWAVVSVSAFAHPERIIRSLLVSKKVPYRLFGAYIRHYLEKFVGCSYDDMAPEKTIGDVRCPVLLVHGQHDETVPISNAHRIRDMGPPDKVELLIVDGDHSFTAEHGLHLGELVHYLANWLSSPIRAPWRQVKA